MDSLQTLTLDQLWLAHAHRGALRTAAQRALNAELARRYRDELVAQAVKQIARGLPAKVDAHILESGAHDGLLEALETYDHPDDVKFSSWAHQLMRFRIFDALRRHDPNSRAVLATERLRREGREALAVAGEPLTEERLRELLGEAARWPRPFVHESSLHQKVYQRDGDARDVELLEVVDTGTPRAESQYERDERIREILAGLAFDDQVILYLRFWYRANLKEIAACFGLSESRLSQRQAELLKLLKLRGKEKFLAAAL